MVCNVLMVSVSLFLLVYWFRYTCLLMLRTKPARDYSKQIAAANHLSVFDVQSQLAATEASGINQSLDSLEKMLDRDYRLLLYLIHHAANFKTASFEIEQIMLRADYQIMRTVYVISKRFSVHQGSRQLSEMALIIAHFANMMGARAALAVAQ